MIRFNIVIYNPQNRQIYISQLEVLLQSIWELYGETAEIAVLYFSVAEKDIKEIKSKIPKIILKEIHFEGGLQAKAARKLNLWYELLLESDRKHQIFMDSDMLLLRKIDKFFDDSFDIGYTHKTDPEEVLRKPLNTGVILVNFTDKNKKKILSFFKYWRDKINKIMDAKNFNGGTRGWGATDQRVLGEILGTRDIKNLKKTVKKKGLYFKGFPCKMLNNIVLPSIENESLYIIHYKGSWRTVLESGTWDNFLQKKNENAIKLFNLWKDNYKGFKESKQL